MWGLGVALWFIAAGIVFWGADSGLDIALGSMALIIGAASALYGIRSRYPQRSEDTIDE